MSTIREIFEQRSKRINNATENLDKLEQQIEKLRKTIELFDQMIVKRMSKLIFEEDAEKLMSLEEKSSEDLYKVMEKYIQENSIKWQGYPPKMEDRETQTECQQ